MLPCSVDVMSSIWLLQYTFMHCAGIDSFESNLQRLADGGEHGQDDMSRPLAGETPMEHIHNLRYSRPFEN